MTRDSPNYLLVPRLLSFLPHDVIRKISCMFFGLRNNFNDDRHIELFINNKAEILAERCRLAT